MNMKHINISIALLFILISCDFRDKLKSNKQITYSFENYFEKIKEIKLDTSKYLSVKYLEVNNSKEFLITNETRSDIFIYDSLGILIRNLSEAADSSFPGINWSPSRGFFTKNNNIFVSNNVPWGIKFDDDGNFINSMPKKYIAGSDLAFDKFGNIFSFTSNQTGIYIDKISSSGEALQRFGNYPNKFSNIIEKAIIGNNLVVTDNHLFFKNIAEPTVYKYDLDGKLIDSFTQIPSYYKEPEKDIRLKPFDLLRRDLLSFAKKHTANYSIHALNKKTILIQYVNYGYKYGIQLVTTDGNYLLDKDLIIKQKILFAKNGLIYTVNNEAKDESDKLLQPIISIYKFREM